MYVDSFDDFIFGLVKREKKIIMIKLFAVVSDVVCLIIMSKTVIQLR